MRNSKEYKTVERMRNEENQGKMDIICDSYEHVRSEFIEGQCLEEKKLKSLEQCI